MVTVEYSVLSVIIWGGGGDSNANLFECVYKKGSIIVHGASLNSILYTVHLSNVEISNT